jgi:putative CocE/NonD family hydrolase
MAATRRPAWLPEPIELEVTSRFGTVVRADAYLPEGSGPFPVLLAASPYQKALIGLPAYWAFPFRETGPIDLYLERGYAFVAVDVPGTGRSEGAWDLVSREEGLAVHDVIEMVATQPWSTGRVGMIGQSAFCWSQWNVARTCPPHLATIVAYDGAIDMYRDWMYHGGIPTTNFVSNWYTSVLSRHQDQGHDVFGSDRYKLIANILSHPFDDEWQRRRAPFWELDRVTIPVLSIGCWGKAGLHLRGNVVGFNRVAGPRKLLVVDAMSSREAFQLYSTRSFHEAEILPWYERYLKGVETGVEDLPPVRYKIPGRPGLRTARSWPPEDAQVVTWFLSGERSGALRSLNDGSLVDEAPERGPDATSWSYPDERWMLGTTTIEEGALDHLARVNTFASGPFREACEFTGDGKVVLFASSDQQDFDVAAKLSVVPAHGDQRGARRVAAGWLRASHRELDPSLSTHLRPFHRHERALPVEPGEVYELEIELLPYSFVVSPGERLVLELSNADSQVLDYVQTIYGEKWGTDTYHHSRRYPSRLVLQRRPTEEGP